MPPTADLDRLDDPRPPWRTEGGDPLPIGLPEHDLRRLLVAQGFPEPERVTALRETVLGGRPTPWSAFRTVRTQGGGRRSTATSYGFRVELHEPVRGPVAVGYGAHFGLGTFTPADDAGSEEP